MKRKYLNITFLLLVGVFMIGYSIYSNSSNDYIFPIPEDFASYDKNLSYEAKYICKDIDGFTQTIIAFIPQQNSALPDNYFGTVEERAYKEIRDAAINMNINLPLGFEKDVQIYGVLK